MRNERINSLFPKNISQSSLSSQRTQRKIGGNLRILSSFVSFVPLCLCVKSFIVCVILFAVSVSGVWAAGKGETVSAEGEEIWQHEFNVSGRKGIFNYIVNATDRAGNESVSGPFNVTVTPNAGLPVAHTVYPLRNSIVRHNINVMGIASGQYGIERVTIRMDNAAPVDVSGTEYWNHLIDFSTVADGRHTFYIQAFDTKGASGPVEALSFILDTAPPVIELKSHRVGDILGGSVTVRGTVSDINGIKTLEYSDDGETFHPLRGQRHGPAAVDFSVSLKTKRLPDGPLIFHIRAVDTTGTAASRPYLFFVENGGPDLAIYTPAVREDVYGKFLLSGRAYDPIGIQRLYYVWGSEKGNIDVRAGDPYWSLELMAGPRSAKNIKITAINKAGHSSTASRRLEDRRRVKVPSLVIDYPPPEVLRAMPADMPVYGHIGSGITPRSVTFTGGQGTGEAAALPSFRIDPQMLRPGRSTLRITPVGADGSRGPAVSLNLNRAQGAVPAVSGITVTSPEKYSWHSASTFTLRGTTSSPGAPVEFRFHPLDEWQSVRPTGTSFNATVNIAHLMEGPIHFEIRSGAGSLPVYHPISKTYPTRAEVHIINPLPADGEIRSNLTVTGSVTHNVPIRSVSASIDGGFTFNEIPFISRFGQAWFSYFCNFFALNENGSRLIIRVIDSAGVESDTMPDYVFSEEPRLPTVIVNTPGDGETVTEAFEISGVAFDEAGIAAVYWRFLGPDPDSVPPGPAANASRAAAARFAANPNVRWNEFPTNQSFQIPINFTQVTDGEYTLETYAADPNGVRGKVDSRIVRVSTAAPVTNVIEPVISRYNRGSIKIRGFSSDANGIADVFVSMDNGNTYQRAVSQENGNWELAVNTVMYTDGIYSALIRTEDNFGVTAFSNAMVNIDNTPPELYIGSPQNMQHTGSVLEVTGRVSDNIAKKNLRFQVISSQNPAYRIDFESSPELVIFESINLGRFPQGEYIVRVSTRDLADNETIVSRKIIYDADDRDAQIAIYNPMPGEVHTGPITVIGNVIGSFIPEEVSILINGTSVDVAPVDRYGYFHYSVNEEQLPGEGAYRFSANYRSETNKIVASPNHTVYYSPYGAVLSVDSHKDGDTITKRPWLSGRTWYSAAPILEGENVREARLERSDFLVKRILVSYDNGKTFRKAKGNGNNWRFRLETGLLPLGPQPVVIKAEFANGEEKVHRILLLVDPAPPHVTALAPPEKSRHRDEILIYGTAGDNMNLADVNISLRPRDKFWYEVPPLIRGLYFDGKALGATMFDVGVGLTFFDDNVRFQAQWGRAPTPKEEEKVPNLIEAGRFTGDVIGIKLMANIFHLPFDFLFGPDWVFYSMNVAIGANFSWFSMVDEQGLDRAPVYMGAIVGQIDIANLNFTHFYPKWTRFRNYALYLEPELWFTTTDVQGPAQTEFRLTAGLRINVF
jgi:hypothetical protein